MGDAPTRPPSVDAVARSIADSGLPHAVCVEIAREAIAAGEVDRAAARAVEFRRSLLGPVINATGVLLHTNLGRAPMSIEHPAAAQNLELDLSTGERGSRHAAVGGLFTRLVGAEAAMIVNNNAAAVLLVLAALAAGRDVLVSRGESVEIGGGFRIPEVMAQSGARLVDVGTTNRTRASDYAGAVGAHTALILKVHPSNYRVEGFVESTPVEALTQLGVPVVADLGSGLLDETCPWLPGAPPAWLAGEPGARQTLAAGAGLVTFSGDKLLGGPQAGIIAGRADLVAACLRHPLARAVRPGGHIVAALQSVALAYLARTVVTTIPFWQMATESKARLRARALEIAAGRWEIVETAAVPGAGSAPGATIPSIGICLPGDHLAALRADDPPVIARSRDGATFLDLRSVAPHDDPALAAALTRCAR
jgi:L-seryl-tRNA(Ser) seleniumtransferase